MKNRLFVYMLIQLLFISCYEDESNMDIEGLNPIVIENVDFETTNKYALYMGDTLKIEPLVYCEGVPDAKMSFEWKLFGGSIVPTSIDSTMYLCAPIFLPPAAAPYTLRFIIKDETTGIKRVETCEVTVLSPFGEGIIVADTKDGINSDLSLVMAREFSDQIPSDNSIMKIFRDVWSSTNSTPLPGLVLDAVTSTYGSNRSLTVLTTTNLLRADHNDFIDIPGEADANMFSVVPPHIGNGYSNGIFTKISSTKDEIMCANGKITNRSTQNSNRKHSYTVYPAGVSDYNVTMMHTKEYYPTYAYDAMGKRMLIFGSWSSFIPEEQGSGSKFDVCDLSDYEPIFIGEVSQGIALLTKKISTGAYKGLVMNLHSQNSPNFAKSVFDFSSATEINQAKYFELNGSEDVLYYATDDKLYTTPTLNTNSKVQWTVEPGDKITGIKIYDWWGGERRHQEFDGTKHTEHFRPSKNKMIMIMTYNEATQKGKITCVPITTFGIGGLEQNKEFHVLLYNFNRILGIYKQEQ